MLSLVMSGSIQVDPSVTTNPDLLLSQAIDLAFKATYDGAWAGSQPIAGTNISPFVLALGAVTKVRAIALRSVDRTSMVAKLSSALGVDQLVPFSDLIVLRLTDADTSPITAIKVVGTGRLEYLIGGDA